MKIIVCSEESQKVLFFGIVNQLTVDCTLPQKVLKIPEYGSFIIKTNLLDTLIHKNVSKLEIDVNEDAQASAFRISFWEKEK